MEKRVYRDRARDLPVYSEVDVLVAGGGPAGFAAAVAAARNGAKTLLVERNGVIGGNATAGLMISWGVRGRFWDGRGEHIITGIPWEFQKRIVTRDGAAPFAMRKETAPYKVVFDVEVYKRVAAEMIREAGVHVLLHTVVCDAIVEGGGVAGIIVENRSGRQAIYAKHVIDATGNGSVCHWVGVPYKTIIGGHTHMFQVGGIDTNEVYRYFETRKETFRGWPNFKRSWDEGYFRLGFGEMEKDPGLSEFQQIFDDAVRDGYITADELAWYLRAAGQTDLKEEFYGYDTQGVEARAGTSVGNVWGYAGVFDGLNEEKITANQLKAVESSWLLWEKVLKRLPGFGNSYMLATATEFGIRASREVETEYKLTTDDVDDGARFDDVVARFSLFKAHVEKYKTDPPRGFDIPLRQILPLGVRRLFIVGNPIGGSLRPQSGCMVLGEAAGICAAVAAKQRKEVVDVPIAELQKVIAENNVNLGI